MIKYTIIEPSTACFINDAEYSHLLFLFLSLSLSLSLSLAFSLYLPIYLSICLSLPLSISISFSLSFFLYLSRSLSPLFFFLPPPPPISLPLFLSNPLTTLSAHNDIALTGRRISPRGSHHNKRLTEMGAKYISNKNKQSLRPCIQPILLAI